MAFCHVREYHDILIFNPIRKIMLVPSKKIALTVIFSLLAGCALSPADFQEKRYVIGDTRLCKTWKSATSSGDEEFRSDVTAEILRRGLNVGRCEQLEREQAIAIGVGVLAGAALVAAARNGGGIGGGAAVGGGAGYASTVYDYDWEWDQFYNQNRALVWACRGVQTGQFADQQHCAGKLMTDWKWPGK